MDPTAVRRTDAAPPSHRGKHRRSGPSVERLWAVMPPTNDETVSPRGNAAERWASVHPQKRDAKNLLRLPTRTCAADEFEPLNQSG